MQTHPLLTTLSVGAFEAYLLKDGVYTAPIADLTHADAATRELAVARWGKPAYAVDVNCFALSGPDGAVLIDAGAGEHWGPAYGQAPGALERAGFSPGDVGVVLLTHLHGDHSLGLLDGEAARYPNALVKAPRADLAYYGDTGNLDATPENMRGSFRNLELVRTAYAGRLVPVDIGPVLPGIDAVALPGHTPGHTGYLVHDDRRSLFVWGDVIHLDAIQFADPAFGLGSDIDTVAAVHSRRVALEMAAREGWYVAGGHVTGIRRVERAGDGYAFAGMPSR